MEAPSFTGEGNGPAIICNYNARKSTSLSSTVESEKVFPLLCD